MSCVSIAGTKPVWTWRGRLSTLSGRSRSVACEYLHDVYCVVLSDTGSYTILWDISGAGSDVGRQELSRFQSLNQCFEDPVRSAINQWFTPPSCVAF
jgi:hypothetical protein